MTTRRDTVTQAKIKRHINAVKACGLPVRAVCINGSEIRIETGEVDRDAPQDAYERRRARKHANEGQGHISL